MGSSKSSLSETIIFHRNHMKMTQAEFATESGIDKALISRLEAGISGNRLTLRTALKLSKAMGMTIGELALYGGFYDK